MITNNWDYITKHPHLKPLQNCKLDVANRSLKNPQPFCKRTKNQNLKTNAGTPDYVDIAPIMNKIGSITSKTTNRTYKTKIIS